MRAHYKVSSQRIKNFGALGSQISPSITHIMVAAAIRAVADAIKALAPLKHTKLVPGYLTWTITPP